MNYPPSKESGFHCQIDYEFLLGGSRPLFFHISMRNCMTSLGWGFWRRRDKKLNI